nr:uncharacterized protein LOC107414520 [Ziziphus jujuba var. spinosa]
MDYQSSFKIRALVQQLRPHVLEVVHTPDFRSCKGADEIRKKMKLLMDLYKEMTLETHKQGKAVSEYHLPPHKRAKLLHPSCKPVDKAVQGSKPSYYGVTKESFRSSHK